MALPWLIGAAAVWVAKEVYDHVTEDNKSSSRDDDYAEERRQRERARQETEEREKKELAQIKIKQWNICIDAYLTADFKNQFQVQNVNDIDSLKGKINSGNFPFSYKSYSDAQKSIDELNNQINFIDEALKSL
jgi:hypothetical protein